MNGIVHFVRVCDIVNHFIVKWCGRFATFLLVLLSCTVFGGVVARFVFNSPFGWTEEFAKYCMVWLTFIGAPVVMVYSSHVAVDILHKYVPTRLLHLLHLAIALFCGLILVLFVWYGWRSAMSVRHQSILIMNGLSMFWVYASVPLGSTVFLFAELVQIMKEAILVFKPEFEETLRVQE